MPDPKPPKPKLTADEVRKIVLDDPNTAKIVEQLGITAEELAEDVAYYATNPGVTPDYQVISDKGLLEKYGIVAPKEQDIVNTFNKELEIHTISEKTDYRDPKEKLVAMPDAPEGKVSDEKPADPKLQAELKKKLTGKGDKI